jgi:hypothetical protein
VPFWNREKREEKRAREGLQRLEHANLVMQMASSNVDSSTRWRITKTGEEALAAGDAAAKLAAS